VASFGNNAIVIAVASAELLTLREELIKLIPAHPSVRHYVPHATLAQATYGKRLPGSLMQAYQEQLSVLLPASVVVPYATLFRWQSARNYSAERI